MGSVGCRSTLWDGSEFHQMCSYASGTGGLELYCVDYMSSPGRHVGAPFCGMAVRGDANLNTLAHEIGHWKKKHILKQLVFMVCASAVLFYVIYLAVAWPPLYLAFGIAGTPVYAGFFLVSLYLSAVSFFVSPIGAAISRRSNSYISCRCRKGRAHCAPPFPPGPCVWAAFCAAYHRRGWS